MAAHATLRRLTIALAILVALALPSAAQASVASRTGNAVTIAASSGETNNVEWFGSGSKITDTAGITAAGECAQVSATEVDCNVPRGDPMLSATVRLGDGNDHWGSDELFQVQGFDIEGGEGNDTLDGSTGADLIHGGPGNDTIFAYSGDDDVSGDEGDDTVKGASGGDTVSGGPGRDVVEGDGQGVYSDGGSDTIDSRDGEVDQVTCGFGADSVTADPDDVIEGGGECESVDQPPPPSSGGLETTLGARSHAKMSELLSKGGFQYALATNAPCRATGSITVAKAEARRRGLGRGKVTLASGSADVPEAGTYTAGLRARGKYRKKLKSLKRLATTLTFSCTAGGVTKQKKHSVTFKR